MNAFDEIYWRYQRAVFLNACRLTRSSAAAEDIVQEVFISLWERRQSINPELPLAGWLFVSSYNRSVNVLKKKLRESLMVDRLVSNDAGFENLPDISELQLNVLNDAISRLSNQKRRVFELCKLHGKTYEEAAEEMKISKHTVKEYLSEAIASIREFVREHPIIGITLTTGMSIFDPLF